MTPRILAPRRRMPLACLGFLTAAEAGILAFGGVALRAVMDAVAAGQGVPAAGGALVFSGLAGCAAAWFRAVLAEDVSMSYANDLRGMLMEHAVASHASRRRLGLLAVRMTGDVTPMREWVSTGLTDAGGAVASIVGGVCILWLAAAWPGAAIGLGLVAALVLALWLAKAPLEARMRALRVERGRVSALAGDIVLSAPTIARYAVVAREKRRFDERAGELRVAAVNRRRLAAMLEIPGGLTLATVTVLAVVVVAAQGLTSNLDLALLFFAAALLAGAFRTAGRAMDCYVAYTVAERRMQALAEQIEAAATRRRRSDPEQGSTFFVAFADDEAIALDQGEVALVRAPAMMGAIDAVAVNAARNGGALLQGATLASLTNKALGRRVALASPSLPLLRASLRRNLSIGRREASDSELRTALATVGLAEWDLERRLDPGVDDPDPYTQMLFRLARALAHGAEAIVIAEPLLYHAPDAPLLCRSLALHANACVLAASAVKPLAGQRAIELGAAIGLAS